MFFILNRFLPCIITVVPPSGIFYITVFLRNNADQFVSLVSVINSLNALIAANSYRKYHTWKKYSISKWNYGQFIRDISPIAGFTITFIQGNYRYKIHFIFRSQK